MNGKKFHWYDPRVAAIYYPGWFVVGYLVIFVLFGTYGNYRVLELRGGITDAAPQTNKKYRVVRTGAEISTLTYLSSLRRGRKLNYVPLDGVLGSEYPYYLLPLASDLLHDFSYSYVKEDPGAPIIKGTPTATSRAPYTQVIVELQKRGETYTVEKAAYELPSGSPLVFSLQDFVEFTPGYWAPRKVIANETSFVFDGWATRDPLRWLHSTNHNMFDSQSVPRTEE